VLLRQRNLAYEYRPQEPPNKKKRIPTWNPLGQRDVRLLSETTCAVSRRPLLLPEVDSTGQRATTHERW
jgi:hypothetical protein